MFIYLLVLAGNFDVGHLDRYSILAVAVSVTPFHKHHHSSPSQNMIQNIMIDFILFSFNSSNTSLGNNLLLFI